MWIQQQMQRLALSFCKNQLMYYQKLTFFAITFFVIIVIVIKHNLKPASLQQHIQSILQSRRYQRVTVKECFV